MIGQLFGRLVHAATRTPARRRVTLAALAAFGLYLGFATDFGRHEPPAPRQAVTATSPSPATPAPAPSPSAPSPTARPVGEGPVDPGPALKVAEAFTAAFLDVADATTSRQWVRGLRPHVTDDLARGFELTDLDLVPRVRVAGQVRVLAASVGQVVLEVPTAGEGPSSLLVSVVREPRGWKVSSVEPGDTR